MTAVLHNLKLVLENKSTFTYSSNVQVIIFLCESQKIFHSTEMYVCIPLHIYIFFFTITAP